MSKGRKVKVIDETQSGRNKKFYDPIAKRPMTRADFANRIEKGEYPNYHVRNLNGLRTPASNPNGKAGDNLG